MILYPWTVQINRSTVKDWGASKAVTKFVYGDTIHLASKIEDFDYLTNAYIPKDFTLDGGNPQALRVLIRKELDSSSTLYSFQDSYNNGELAGFGDLTVGQVEWSIALSDAQIKTDLDAAGGTLTAYLEISYLDGNAIPSTIVQVPITIVDQVDDGAAGTPPPSSPVYLTAVEIAAIYVPIDGQMFWGAQSATTTTPPTLTTSGDIYVIPTGATGAWSSNVGKVAVDNGTWTYYTPVEGWTVKAIDDAKFYQYVGTSWITQYGNSSQTVTQVTHGLSVGEAVYNAAGTWTKAIATAADTLGVGIVIRVDDADTFTYQSVGMFDWSAHGFTVGEFLLVSAGTAGLLTETAPTGLTQFLNPIAYVVDSDSILILPYRPFQAVDRSNDLYGPATVTTTPYNVTDLDEYVPVDATAAPAIVNLPDPSTVPVGYTCTVKKVIEDVSANSVTAKSASGDIEGVLGTTGYVITFSGDSRTFRSNGTDYEIV